MEAQIQKDRPYISLKYETFTNTRSKATFVDEEYGEWGAKPSNMLTRNGKHPKRAVVEQSRRRRTPEDVEAQIQKDRPYISLKYETFINVSKKATFVDEEYGEWGANPKNILEGGGHPNRSMFSKGRTAKAVEAQIQKDRPYISLKHETFTNMRSKATFVDEEYGEWEAKPNSVISMGSGNPARAKMLLEPKEVESRIQKDRPWISLKYGTFMGTKHKATFVDEKYGEWETKAGGVLDGNNHPERAKNTEKRYRRTPEDVEAQIQKDRPWISLKYETFINLNNKATFVDEKYGEWTAYAKHLIYQKANHPSRAVTTSNLEKILGDAIGLDKNIMQIQLNGRVIIPDFGTGIILIECDGLYWHSEKHKENSHHFIRREDAEACGYELLQFRGDEIENKLPIVTSIINNKRGKSSRKIYARTCELRAVESAEAYDFFESNHLMGGTKLKAYGLFYNDELVQAMSFQNREDGLHIGRFCSKLETQILGGQSKLMSAIIKNQNPKLIVNFVDLRYGNGKSLIELGFKLEKITLGWRWTDGVNTYNRLSCRANMDDQCLTQAQQADEYGWCKIYDAGQAKYTYNAA